MQTLKKNRWASAVCAMLIALLAVMPVRMYAAYAADSSETSADSAEYYLEWDDFREANGVTDWNYNDLADAIAGVAYHAVDLYTAGEMDDAYNFAKATYWGYYETSGFERNTMNYISSSRVSEVELAFTNFRKAVKKDNGVEAVQAAADSLVEMLRTDGLILSPEGPVYSGEAASAASSDSSGGIAAGQAAVFDTYYLEWDECREAEGITDWNYNDLASVIAGVADHAVGLYQAGEMDEAYEFAKATYWGYYETSGFERNTMNYISSSRVSEVELAFTNFRKAVKKDNGVDAVQAAADDLTSKLFEDALILSPGGPVAVGQQASAESTGTVENTSDTTTKSAASGFAVFLGSFAIILREGLEAILIVGAIIAYLIKSGNKKGVMPVYIGSVFAIVCSFIMAGILNYLLSKSAEYHMSQEIIEGVAALTAVAVLFYVSNWMISKSESAAWTSYIEGKAQGGVSRGSMFTLGFTAWLAVFREGAEVILFYQPMLAEDRPDMVWAGFLVGVVCLVAVFLAIRFLSVRLPIGPFFTFTSLFMAAMSICFLGSGIKELMEGGVLDNFEIALMSPSWLSWIPYNDTLDILGIYPLVGTIVPQLILLVITIVTFVMHIRKNKKLRQEMQAKQAA